jgi:hypothetical protein
MSTTISEEQFWTSTLQAAGLPVKRAYKETYDDGTFEIQAEFLQGLTAEQNLTFLTITNPIKAEFLQSRQQYKDEYQNTLTTLQQIVDAQNPTNAQVVAAMKFIAKTLKLLLKIIIKFI